jgi:hypothetical protein
MTNTVGTAPDTSPEGLLKQAVMGARTTADAKPAGSPSTAATPTRWMRIDPRLLGVAGAALVIGGLVGAGATRLGAAGDDRAGTALAAIQQRLGAAQAETDRVSTALAELGKKLAHAQETVDTGRGEARTRGTATLERVARAEQALTAKFAALSERFEQIEKDQAGRIAALTAQLDKRAAPAPAAAPVAAKASPEPMETGSISDAKAHAAAKPAATDNWAVREVYDGVAVLEDRKRRLVEVGIGDTVPGVGRVETIERRGRAWAVVTRQGIITAQTW